MEKARRELTDRQRHVLGAIQAWIKEHGFPPTIRELGRLLGIKSLRGVTTHLDALAKKGTLVRNRSARGIRILADSVAPTVEHTLRIPVLGPLPAGLRTLTEESVQGYVVFDAAALGVQTADPAPRYVAVRARGGDMRGAGILDGDYVIVHPQATAEHGDLVAAQCGDETVIRRAVKDQDRLRLQAESPTEAAASPTPAPESATILGRVVAIMRVV